MNKTRKYLVSVIIFFIIAASTSCRANKVTPHQGEVTSNPPISESIYDENNASNVMPIPPKVVTPPAPQPVQTPAQKSKPAKQIQPKREASDPSIASFSTSILDQTANRVNNIRLAANKINGFVIKPGETFSFNEVVGKRDYEHGYRKARILIKGKPSEDIGGGICQLSSTIYNTATRANLKILERHTHSGDVCYVPRGQDAAVSYGYLDLKFKNTKPYSIKLKVIVQNGRIYASVIKI